MLRTALPLLITLPGCLAAPAGSQSPAPQSPILQRLAAEAAQPGALESFWATVRKDGTPLLEPDPADPSKLLVTYVFRDQPGVASVGLMNAYNFGNQELKRLPGTDLWFASESRPKGYQGFYGFKVSRAKEAGPAVIADPLNPHRMHAPAGPELPPSLKDDAAEVEQTSLLLTPGVEAPACLDPRPGVPQGRVEEATVPSTRYPSGRKVWIYTPPGYDPQAKEGYGTLLCFDGAAYLGTTPLPTVLDNLLAEGKLPPLVAILVDNGSGGARLGDLANHQAFADFVALELMPWVQKRWRITENPRRTLVTGFSAGGLGAVYVAAKHPERFGNVFSQSGAVWRGNEGSSTEFEYLKGVFAAMPKRDLRFYMEVGARETAHPLGTGPVFIEANRRLRDTLLAKGYEVTYQEVPEANHEPVHWRNVFPGGLLALVHGWGGGSCARAAGGKAGEAR